MNLWWKLDNVNTIILGERVECKAYYKNRSDITSLIHLAVFGPVYYL